MAETVKWIGTSDWEVQEIQQTRKPYQSKTRRGAEQQESLDVLNTILVDKRFSIIKEFLVTPPTRVVRGGSEPEIAFETELSKDETSVLAVRHPSGALSFHAPEVLATVRRGGKSATTTRFRVALRG